MKSNTTDFSISNMADLTTCVDNHNYPTQILESIPYRQSEKLTSRDGGTSSTMPARVWFELKDL